VRPTPGTTCSQRPSHAVTDEAVWCPRCCAIVQPDDPPYDFNSWGPACPFCGTDELQPYDGQDAHTEDRA
jgi:hypothetical protein